MAIQSNEFVGIAEGIKSHELSLNGRIEKLRDTIRELSRTKRYLDRQVSYLEASLDAAYNKTDENGDFDYGRITSIEAQISEVERLQSEVESQLNTTNGELSYLEIELNSVLSEKAQTLYEIQERARKTSNNIAFAGGMYGAYAGVGSALQNSMRISLSSLSQAASILDGSVDAFFDGGTSGGQGHSAAGNSSTTRDLSTSALSAFSTGNSFFGSIGGSASSPSAFESSQIDVATPASMSGFRSSSKTINAQKSLNFKSDQDGNKYAVSAFTAAGDEVNSVQSQKFTSSQISQGANLNFSEDGTLVTYLDNPSSDSTGRKYTDGVVFEGTVTYVDSDHVSHTVAIKRKVHQYASGIDLNYKRPDGKTNYEAMLEGKSPIILIQTANGVVETRLDLHHLIQEETIKSPGASFSQGSLVEMPAITHQKFSKTIHMQYPIEKGVRRSFRWDKNADHTYTQSSDDKQFEAFKKKYWRTRALMGQTLEKRSDIFSEHISTTRTRQPANNLDYELSFGSLLSNFKKKRMSDGAPVDSSAPNVKSFDDQRDEFIKSLQVKVKPSSDYKKSSTNSSDDDNYYIGARERPRVRQRDTSYYDRELDIDSIKNKITSFLRKDTTLEQKVINQNVNPVENAQKLIDNYCHASLSKILPESKQAVRLSDTVEFQDEGRFALGLGGSSLAAGVNGYNDGKMSYVKSNGPHPQKTAIHEHNHQLSCNDVKDNLGHIKESRRGISINGRDTQINEALTEYFTKKMMGSEYPANPDVGYIDNMLRIEKMESAFGEELLKTAYYQNQPQLLKDKYESVMGKGAWDNLSLAFNESLRPHTAQEVDAIREHYAKTGTRITTQTDVIRKKATDYANRCATLFTIKSKGVE